eukprot:7350802-Alexandrium_andersonii.AAC.1
MTANVDFAMKSTQRASKQSFTCIGHVTVRFGRAPILSEGRGLHPCSKWTGLAETRPVNQREGRQHRHRNQREGRQHRPSVRHSDSAVNLLRNQLAWRPVHGPQLLPGFVAHVGRSGDVRAKEWTQAEGM